MNKETDLTKLKKGDVLYSTINEDLANALSYVLFQEGAMKNLFNSYLSLDNETTNKMNLDKFLDKYFKIVQEKKNIGEKLFTLTIGEEKENYLKENYLFSDYFDLKRYLLKITIINKKGEK